MKKAAVLFPGIGYSVDRPLLYYSGKMALSRGYEVIRVPYTGFPEKIAGDHDMMMRAFDVCRRGAEEILKDAHLEDYDELIFFSKSVGTAVGGSYAADHGLDGKVRHVLYTPVPETFGMFRGTGIAFHGTADPWAPDGPIIEAARACGVPLYLFEGANHSLETGGLLTDIGNLKKIMETVSSWLFPGSIAEAG